MSYIYNPQIGSLAELRRRIGHEPDVDDRDEIGEILDEITTQPSQPEAYLIADLRWDEIDDVTELAERRVSAEAAGLVDLMFGYAPFGLTPDGPGYVGCLESEEIRRLRELLEQALPAERVAVATDPRSAPDEDRPLVAVLLALRAVPAGQDLFVTLG